TFVINEMLKIFDKLYDLKSTGGPMFEQYMRNAMQLIMDHPESGSTLMEIPKVLADEDFRAFKLSKCTTQVVKDFWIKEAQKAGGEASLQNMVPYITSKLTPFIANDIMRPIIGQQKSAFNVREAMDEGKILLLNLTKGKLGDINAYLIGMVLVGKILMSALSRTDMDPSKRKDFYLYIDEFQNFLTDSISAILSEARKYGLDLIIAHQFIGQLTQKGDTLIRDAIFGNVGSKAVFRVGADDAEFLEKEFSPTFGQYDLVNVEGLHCLTRLLIDNTASQPFKMKIEFAPRADAEGKELAKTIAELSRYKYGRKRELVEAEIQERASSVEQMMGEQGFA
ncbi:TraM recognition domain-containing protein, partial [Candidatus Uhrbacteria bacterium]|nr:TraM recognition domain-containing protein [Candidatus Uhrbacteria bacterium]